MKKPTQTRTKTSKPSASRSRVAKPATRAKTPVSRATAARSSSRTKAVSSRAKVSSTKKRTVKAKAPLHKRAKSHAKTVLVPHKENDYRPHLIRAHGLIAVLVVALIAQVFYGFITTGHLSILGRASNIETSELLVDTNAERTAQGLSELQLNDSLSQAAFLKAQNMLSEQYWAHVSPSGVQPWKWFGDVGYNYSYAGENLAKNYPTAQATISAWMNSQSHRENILNDKYADVGFAVVDGELNGENTTLVVALYGAPVTVAAVQAASTQQAGFMAPGVASASQNPLTYFGTALEALSPATIAILGLLAVVAIVGVAAHHYRHSLPKHVHKSWRQHQGFYTFLGMIGLSMAIIIATGGGQI